MHPASEPQNPKPSYRFAGDSPPPPFASWSDKPRWVAWKYVWRKGKWTKPPINPRTGAMASVSDPMTWGTFADALACMKEHGLAGVGIILSADDEDDLAGGDLDHCVTDFWQPHGPRR